MKRQDRGDFLRQCLAKAQAEAETGNFDAASNIVSNVLSRLYDQLIDGQIEEETAMRIVTEADKVSATLKAASK
jgi:hypothetical protein